MNAKQKTVEDAKKSLAWLKPGDTLQVILRHVSRSGMLRIIDVYAKGATGELEWIGPKVAEAIGAPYDRKRNGIKMSGCGTDMGFEIAYALGYALYPQGFGVLSEGGIRPSSKEESARLVSEGKTAFRGRNGDTSGWDPDGGYAFRKTWL